MINHCLLVHHFGTHEKIYLFVFSLAQFMEIGSEFSQVCGIGPVCGICPVCESYIL